MFFLHSICLGIFFFPFSVRLFLPISVLQWTAPLPRTIIWLHTGSFLLSTCFNLLWLSASNCDKGRGLLFICSLDCLSRAAKPHCPTHQCNLKSHILNCHRVCSPEQFSKNQLCVLGLFTYFMSEQGTAKASHANIAGCEIRLLIIGRAA